MNFKNITLAALATICTVTTQTNPMIGYYLAALGGDACLIASSAALGVEKILKTIKQV